MKKQRPLYPGCADAEKEKGRRTAPKTTAPEMIGAAPNYDAFPGWAPEKVLAWLNID